MYASFVTWNREPPIVLLLNKSRENLTKLLQLELRLKLARAKLQLKTDQDALKPVG